MDRGRWGPQGSLGAFIKHPCPIYILNLTPQELIRSVFDEAESVPPYMIACDIELGHLGNSRWPNWDTIRRGDISRQPDHPWVAKMARSSTTTQSSSASPAGTSQAATPHVGDSDTPEARLADGNQARIPTEAKEKRSKDDSKGKGKGKAKESSPEVEETTPKPVKMKAKRAKSRAPDERISDAADSLQDKETSDRSHKRAVPAEPGSKLKARRARSKGPEAAVDAAVESNDDTEIRGRSRKRADPSDTSRNSRPRAKSKAHGTPPPLAPGICEACDKKGLECRARPGFACEECRRSKVKCSVARKRERSVSHARGRSRSRPPPLSHASDSDRALPRPPPKTPSRRRRQQTPSAPDPSTSAANTSAVSPPARPPAKRQRKQSEIPDAPGPSKTVYIKPSKKSYDQGSGKRPQGEYPSSIPFHIPD
jgi:hypothetical protein